MYLEFDDKGVSLVLVNSNKGKQLFREIENNFEYIETNKEKAISYNSAMVKSVYKPKKREKFLRKVSVNNFEKLTLQCIRIPLYIRLKRKIKLTIYKIIKGEK